jgi:hypothetical protein
MGEQAIDHERLGDIRTAAQINIYKYGDELVRVLSLRQKVAQILLRATNESEIDHL